MSLRYERKYLVPPDKKFQLDALLSTHPAGFYEVYPPRYVNSIYFDDAANTNWSQSEEGFFDRKKIRIRWYGPLQGTITAPRLEIKYKQGLLGGKQIFPLSPFTLHDHLHLHEIHDLLITSDLPDEIRSFMRMYAPSLMNRYHRTYHLSADSRYRITIDHGITYFAVNSNITFIGGGLQDPIPTVLELKYSREADADADAISNNWPFRLSRKSKYATGMNLTKDTCF